MSVCGALRNLRESCSKSQVTSGDADACHGPELIHQKLLLQETSPATPESGSSNEVSHIITLLINYSLNS